MWKSKEYNEDIETRAKEEGLSPLVSRLIAQRPNVQEDYDRFIDPKYSKMSNPTDIPDFVNAAKIFGHVVKNKGRVIVVGDYDCDGITSTTMLKLLCEAFSIECVPFLPSRLNHGYGLSDKLLEEIGDKVDLKTVDLAFIVDSGSNHHEAIQALKDKGVSAVIVIDHHIIEPEKEVKSADVFINWHKYEGYNEMCAAGLVYQFIRTIRSFTDKIQPVEYLSIAAVGTIGDSSPLVGDNRILVKNGLSEEAISNCRSIGLATMLNNLVLRGTSISQQTIAFKVVPQLNAAGRVDSPDVALMALIAQEPSDADRAIKRIEAINEKRKKMQSAILKEALQQASALKKNGELNGLFLVGDGWHIGVAGIVAAKLVEKFGCPAVVVGEHDGKWKGSGRAPGGVNLKQILDDCPPEMFLGYGGHSAAVGVTYDPEFKGDPNAAFNEVCKKAGEVSGEVKSYDAELRASSVTLEMAKEINKVLYPYSQDHNPEPVFKLSNATLCDVSIRDGRDWRLIKFGLEKDGQMAELGATMFSLKYGSEIDGVIADVYFTFPNVLSSTDSRTEISVTDIVLK